MPDFQPEDAPEFGDFSNAPDLPGEDFKAGYKIAFELAAMGRRYEGLLDRIPAYLSEAVDDKNVEKFRATALKAIAALENTTKQTVEYMYFSQQRGNNEIVRSAFEFGSALSEVRERLIQLHAETEAVVRNPISAYDSMRESALRLANAINKFEAAAELN